MKPAQSLQRLVIPLALVALCLSVFGPVTGFEFLNYDDEGYVTQNPAVLAGLTVRGVAWAFTAAHMSNWHPLTWMSHMLDISLFGPTPGGHHLVNLLLHAAVGVALYSLLRAMTGSLWAGALTAALFIAHPLHVESVAWVSERKDVLSGLCFMMTLWSYLWYLRRPSPVRYATVSGLYVLALLAKPMVVTIPFVLLLLDWWPLGRWAGSRAASRLLAEKLPFMAFSAASSAMTVWAQASGGSMGTLERYPIQVRMSNAVIAAATYLGKTFWPTRLAVFYPYPLQGWPPWRTVFSGALLAAVTAAALLLARRKPYLTAGWLWYLGMLVPVIGLVQVGAQAMADRYTYLPLIGIFLTVALGARDLAQARPGWRMPLAAFFFLAVAVLAAAGRSQVGWWRDTPTLFSRAIAVTGDNWLAQGNLGAYYYLRGQPGPALHHLQEVVRLRPRIPKARLYAGKALLDLGRNREALDMFGEALRLNPNYAEALSGMGQALERLGKSSQAEESLHRALTLDPAQFRAALALGDLLSRQRRFGEAAEAYRKAVRAEPGRGVAYNNLGASLLALGQIEEAAAALAEALRLQPDSADTLFNLGVVLERQGKRGEALRRYREALARSPAHEAARTRVRALAEGEESK